MSTLIPFLRSYANARAAFVKDALDAEADIESYSHYDEDKHPASLANFLLTDVATIGRSDAETVVVTTSGIQGIDLFHGSALQRLWIREAAHLINKEKPPARFVFAHALNPIASFYKRHDGDDCIDLSRNFVPDFALLPPLTGDFFKLSHCLTPLDLNPESIRTAMSELKIMAKKYGTERFISTLSQGQSHLPRSLFYTGKVPTRGLIIWNALVDRLVLKNAPEKIIHINLRSGLGPWGVMRILPASKPSTYATQMVYGTACVSGIPALCALTPAYGNIVDYWPHLNKRGAKIAAMTLEVGISNEEGWDALRAIIKRHTLSVRYRDYHPDTQKIIDQFEATFCPRHRKWQELVMYQGGKFFEKLTAHL